MKDILKVVFVIIGTMIGAGFASGQEIWIFFNRYGNLGILGLILSISLSGFLIYKVFNKLQKENLYTYSQLLEKISGKGRLNKIISIIISVFLLVSFYIMIAGMSAYFYQEFGLSTWFYSIITSIFCYFTLKRNIKGIVAVNSFLIPCLIIFILFLGLKNFDFSLEYLNTQNYSCSWNWFISSILYASYNSILLIPILIELKTYINTKKKAVLASFLCTIILFLIALCLFFLLLRNPAVYKFDLPMVEIAKEFGAIYAYFYGGVIVAAIFTSAISAGYGFLQNQVEKKEFIKGDIEKRKRNYYNKLLFAICILAPFVANLGFANLVNALYPVFGVLGLIQIVFLVK